MTYKDHGLGRLALPDERDKNFPLQAVVPSRTQRTFRYWWPSGWWGDQQQTPQCVAYSWVAWLEDGPWTKPPRSPNYDAVHGQGDAIVDPEWLYCQSQKKDPWKGDCDDPRYDGTSVRAGAKVLQQELGLIDEYRWAWDLKTAVRAVLEVGPVIMGTWWYTSMNFPDSTGFVGKISGQREGGHAYKWDGVNVRSGVARFKNSWGRDYGKNGYFYLRLEDVEHLIREGGEVCMPIGIHL